MKNLRVTSAVPLTCVLLLLCASPAHAEDAYGYAYLKEYYAFTNWVGKTKVNYVRLATNWVPDFAALSTTTSLLQSITTNDNGTTSREFGFQAKDDASVTIGGRAYTMLSVTNAHEVVIKVFSSCSGGPAVEGTGRGVDIGDRCYLGTLTNEVFVCFVRNNILIHMQSSDGKYSVIHLARELDKQILKISTGQ